MVTTASNIVKRIIEIIMTFSTKVEDLNLYYFYIPCLL